jgi:hypothetical protein
MAQLRDDLAQGLGEGLLVALGIALALLVEQRHRQGQRGQGQGNEDKVEDDAVAKGREAQARHVGQLGQLHPSCGQAPVQRKPRIGMFSMPSNAGSTSRKASRMVATCLRTLSRLRPLFTTSNSSS